MPISTAPALLVGLGARVFLNTVYRGPLDAEVSIRETVLVGVWQGVALHCAGKHNHLVIFISIAISLKLFYDFAVSPDVPRCLTTIIGLLLGVAGTELLSSYVDQFFFGGPAVEPRKRTRSLATASAHRHITVRHVQDPHKPRTERTVQFKSSVQGGSVETEVNRAPQTLASDITSVQTAFEVIGHKPSATLVEREIAALRARASLADSERRRYREERKWALSQGNLARAEQTKSEYNRYKALMESCHREADLKLLAMQAPKERGSRGRNRESFDFPRDSPRQKHSPYQTRGDHPANGHSHLSPPSYQVGHQRFTRPRDPSR